MLYSNLKVFFQNKIIKYKSSLIILILTNEILNFLLRLNLYLLLRNNQIKRQILLNNFNNKIKKNHKKKFNKNQTLLAYFCPRLLKSNKLKMIKKIFSFYSKRNNKRNNKGNSKRNNRRRSKKKNSKRIKKKNNKRNNRKNNKRNNKGNNKRFNKRSKKKNNQINNKKNNQRNNKKK